ncbi:hypothetical protein [Acinetobacter soli]|uniref:hypothetical protein n=1 Tax=Acinetobacter soli TaxID=487316 RepID=UPI00125D7497|nr:hypothetical protein [Acinetobacter soli]
MNNLLKSFLNNSTQWHNTGLTLIKTFIAIGVLCLVAYLLTIQYVPSEISFGDTLVFLLIFASCAVVYAILSTMLFFFGISLLPVTYLFLSIADKFLPAHIRIGKKLPFPKISVITLLSSLYLLYLIHKLLIKFWQISLYVAASSAFISLFYYAFYLHRKKIKEFNAKFEDLTEIVDDVYASDNLKLFAQKKIKQFDTYIKSSMEIIISLALIPLIPMVFIPDIGKLFLNYTMQNTGVRLEKVTIYLKEPYASLVELPKTTTKALSEQQIFKIKDVNILFQGVGKNTLLSYRLNGNQQKIIIPNEFIIVEQRRKLDESK